MDYDSSTKFISSLAKFLQSLCNGYVEFDNGVQVIGHLYLNVDTGKTIDYVLNEKVCKTDENSVTFISNSFHAQPAEKPQPAGKRAERETEKINAKAAEQEEGSQLELRNTNVESDLPQNDSYAHSGTKRPHSPSHPKSGRTSPRHKRKRNHLDPSASDHRNLSSASDPMQEQPSHDTAVFNESYQQSYLGGNDNSLGESHEQADIKPSLDTDVTFIKEEYAPSSNLPLESEDDGNQNESAYSSSYSSQQYHSGGYGSQGGYPSSQSSMFNPGGEPSMYSSGPSPLDTGAMAGDPSGVGLSLATRREAQVRPRDRRKGCFVCEHCSRVFSMKQSLTRHKWKCESTRILVCRECGRQFHRVDRYKAHMQIHHPVRLLQNQECLPHRNNRNCPDFDTESQNPHFL